MDNDQDYIGSQQPQRGFFNPSQNQNSFQGRQSRAPMQGGGQNRNYSQNQIQDIEDYGGGQGYGGAPRNNSNQQRMGGRGQYNQQGDMRQQGGSRPRQQSFNNQYEDGQEYQNNGYQNQMQRGNSGPRGRGRGGNGRGGRGAGDRRGGGGDRRGGGGRPRQFGNDNNNNNNRRGGGRGGYNNNNNNRGGRGQRGGDRGGGRGGRGGSGRSRAPLYQPNGDEPIVLMVAEKPSIAKSIGEALSQQWGGLKVRKGVSKYCNILEFYGDIFGQPALIRITSVTGHIYITDFSDEFQDWHKVDPVLLFDATTVKKEANPENNLVQHLRQEAIDASYLVLWLDNDKEGENICFEVLENVRDVMRQEPFQQVFRARFSSVTKQDIMHAYNTLSDGPNQFEAISVDARQIIDLKIGVAFSRFQTVYLKKKYENLTQRLITFGPCQTPTLGFCVERHLEIDKFQQQQFWRVVPYIQLNDGRLQSIDWDNERTFVQDEANQVKQDIGRVNIFRVVEVSSKEGSRGRPEGLDTVHLLKAASSQLKIGPNQAMQVAEKLYLGGFITYPRTESTTYPRNFDFMGVLNSLLQLPLFNEYVDQLLQEGLERPKQGKDAGDHPPITPTLKTPQPGELGKDEWRMYEYVSRHFLGTVSPDAKFSKRTVKFQAGTHLFSLQGTTILSTGFTQIMTWVKIYDKTIPDFQEGQTYIPVRVDIIPGKTTPPEYLTESDLITLMEKNGIGTDASMATHIGNICDRNYVKVITNNRRLQPTELGLALVAAYNKIDSELVAPNLRSNIEKSVELIAKGIADCKKVLEEVLAIFKEKFLYFRENIQEMDIYFKEIFITYQDAIINAQFLSGCGRCGEQMKYLSNSNKLNCPKCRYTYSLPQGGEIEVFEENAKCPIDNFQLVVFKPNQMDSIPLLLCPSCYNKSPYPQVSNHLKCMDCPLTDCKYNGYVFKTQKQQSHVEDDRQPFSTSPKQNQTYNNFVKINKQLENIQQLPPPLPPQGPQPPNNLQNNNNNNNMINKRQRPFVEKENNLVHKGFKVENVPLPNNIQIDEAPMQYPRKQFKMNYNNNQVFKE